MQLQRDSTTKCLRRDDVIELLRAHEADLRKLGVRSLALFGSVVRDEARPDSDVDIMAEYEEGVTLFGLARLNRYLEELLGAEIDLSERKMIHKELQPRIYREAVNVFSSATLEHSVGKPAIAHAPASRPVERDPELSEHGARQLQESSGPKAPQRDGIMKLLQSHERELRKLGVLSLALFGSVARDEGHPNSDVDVMVDLDDGVTLFGFARLNRYLEEILGTRVDLVMRGAIIKELRDRIYGEAVNVI
ncbi:MAG: nucleotidyltransferase domain-containing protein [Chloroflexi bacterium]|nr:nucleotidyltransferase domain-containing protein [Chloroflexota bacterium]